MHPRLVVDRGAELFKRGCGELAGGWTAKQGSVEQAADEGVAGLVHMAAVDRVLEARLRRELLPGGVEEVGEGEAPLLGDGLGGVAVEGERIVLGLSVGQVGAAAGLDRDGRHDHEPWGCLRVVAGILLRQFIKKLLVVGRELGHAFRPGERLVEAEEEQVGVGAEGGHGIVELRVVTRPLAVADLVGGAGEVADHEVLAGETLVEQGLEVAEEAHPFCGGVAQEGDPLAVEHLKGKPAGRQRRSGGPRRNGQNLAGRGERIGVLSYGFIGGTRDDRGREGQQERDEGSSSSDAATEAAAGR